MSCDISTYIETDISYRITRTGLVPWFNGDDDVRDKKFYSFQFKYTIKNNGVYIYWCSLIMYVVNFGYNIKCATIGISKKFPLNLCGEIRWSIYLTLKHPLIAFAFAFLGWLLFLFDISIFQFDNVYKNINSIEYYIDEMVFFT